jgi:hypothetical protein
LQGVADSTRLDQPTTTATPHTPVMPKLGEYAPGPRSEDQISLSDERDGPTMRLLRSHRHSEVLLQFDQKPSLEIIAQIKAEHYRWEPRVESANRHGAWAKKLEGGREVRGMLDAERLFPKLGNEIRQGKGLEPVGGLGAA